MRIIIPCRYLNNNNNSINKSVIVSINHVYMIWQQCLIADLNASNFKEKNFSQRSENTYSIHLFK